MVIGNCEHVANSKETVLFFAILHCDPTDFNCKWLARSFAIANM